MTREEDRYKETFSPYLWRQRRTFILDILRRFKVETVGYTTKFFNQKHIVDRVFFIQVLDYGCGEATVLSYLISPNEPPITKIAGIDICDIALAEAVEQCTPWQTDYEQLRDYPLVVDVYKGKWIYFCVYIVIKHFLGSIGNPDDRFKNFQAIICTEVIEHVYPEVLDTFLETTLGIYQPEMMIVTTPNAEYNINFPDLKYGTSESTFRHDDHKFEWTRKKFESWCLEGADKYGYNVEYQGIGLLTGKEDDLEHGHCTQACIFTRQPEHRVREQGVHGQPHALLKHVEFPYYNEPPPPTEKIMEELKNYIEVLCISEMYANQVHIPKHSPEESVDIDLVVQDWNNVDLSQFQIPNTTYEPMPLTTPRHEPICLPVSSLWDIKQLRRICVTKEKMMDLLGLLDTKDYELYQDKLVVQKVFDIGNEDDDLSACTFSSRED